MIVIIEHRKGGIFMVRDGQFTMMNRTEFLDWITVQGVSREITHIQNHHTWLPNYNTGNDMIQIMKDMKNYHVNVLRWADIAQQFSTNIMGLICTGRIMDIAPAGIAGHNTGGICIEHIGNFDDGGDTMSDEHKKTIAFVNAALLVKFKLPLNTDTVVYHNWFGYLNDANIKTCPGSNFFGGNTKQDAIDNLFPLIASEMRAVTDSLNFRKAVNYKPIISSPDYWKKNAVVGGVVNGAYMHQVILNYVAMYKLCSSFEEVLGVMKDRGIISSLDYWRQNAVANKSVSGEYARIVLTRMGAGL
jgi:hypothetical protein